MSHPTNPGLGSYAFKAALNGAQARPLARQNVRMGMDVQQASWHAAMSVMLFNVIGAVVIYWCLLAAPMILLSVSEWKGVYVMLLRLALIIVDTATTVAFIGSSLTWIRNNPRTVSGWRRTVSRPWVIAVELLSILPAHVLVLAVGWLGMKVLGTA